MALRPPAQNFVQNLLINQSAGTNRKKKEPSAAG